MNSLSLLLNFCKAELWAETLDLKVLADLDNLLPRVEATLRELADRGKTGKTISNVAEALRSFCNWCVIRNYLSKRCASLRTESSGTRA